MTTPLLSLAFFGADAGDLTPDVRYRQLLELCGAADRGGLHAVWFPERHFQDFGDVFPNPAVLAAAIAAVTDRIQLRAGSVVAPLHHPLRMLEDWSMVQALSGGRAGVSLATGWNATDFALNPDAFDDRRSITYGTVERLRSAFAHRSVSAVLPGGERADVTPRPVPDAQEIPLWITTSGTPNTWLRAAELGVGVLASTIGQTSESLAANIDAYRQECTYHATEPWVTLMVHTAIGASRDAVRAEVEDDLKVYLLSFLSQSPNSHEERSLGLMVDFAFERYWNEMSMLGTVETVARTVAHFGAIECDEVACLVDFGPGQASMLRTIDNIAGLQGR